MRSRKTIGIEITILAILFVLICAITSIQQIDVPAVEASSQKRRYEQERKHERLLIEQERKWEREDEERELRQKKQKEMKAKRNERAEQRKVEKEIEREKVDNSRLLRRIAFLERKFMELENRIMIVEMLVKAPKYSPIKALPTKAVEKEEHIIEESGMRREPTRE